MSVRADRLRKAAVENSTPVNAYQATDEDLPEILQTVPVEPSKPQPQNITALSTVPKASEAQIVRPLLSPEQAKAEWQNYIDTCRAILEESDYSYYACAKKPDGYDAKPIVFRTRAAAEAQLELYRKQGFRELLVKETKKRSAWDKLARFYGIDTPIESAALCTTVEISQVGDFIIEKLAGDSFSIIKYQDAATLTVKKANVLLRMVAPNGRVILGDGACSTNERSKGADSFTHPDHDIFATAFTRAFNRGISRCIGTGEVSAEEFDDAPLSAEPAATVASAPQRDTEKPVTVAVDAAPKTDAAPATAAPKPNPEASPVAPQGTAAASSQQPTGNGKSVSASPDAYQVLPEAASNSDRLKALEAFCFGKSPSDNRLIRYLPFAVGLPAMLAGPFVIEENGKWNPKKWETEGKKLGDRAERLKFMEQQLSMLGRDMFIKWGEAMVDAARKRGVFGK